jgi:hypothetical protein
LKVIVGDRYGDFQELDIERFAECIKRAAKSLKRESLLEDES